MRNLKIESFERLMLIYDKSDGIRKTELTFPNHNK